MSKINVEVVLAHSNEQIIKKISVKSGATALDAINQTGLPFIEGYGIGIFGQEVDKTHLLSDGDRVEILRPLAYSPNDLRLLRIKKNS